MIDTADPVMLLKEIERLSARVRDLESSGHRLQATLYGIGDGLIVTDVSGSVLQMNPTAEALTGWQESEARGLPVEQVFSIVDERTRRRVESPVTTILREGKVLGLANHALLISRDGRGIPIADSGSPIRDANGDISGVVFVFRDLTEEHLTRRYIETRLSLIEYASNHTLEALLTKALDEVGGFVDSPIGFYHFVDRDQKTLFLQQWSTRTLNEFCHAEGKGIHYPIDRAGVWVECVYQKKPVIHNDYAALPHKKGMPKGHAAVIRELVVPVMREDKVVAILGVGNKPTDYTDKDVDIVSYLADVTWEIVRQKLVEKDQEKLQHQLIQSQKMESLGRLAGGVAHDYNNILSVIVGYAELVMEKMTPGHSLREDLEEILKAAHRSHDFTRQLLVFARKETIVPEVLDLNTTVESLLKVLRRLIGENIHLVWLPGAPLWQIKMDPSQLDQILTNLCVNARDAIHDVGKITIETAAVAFDDDYCADHPGFVPGDFVMLAVTDDGCGMNKDIIDKVFEPFFTTKGVGTGTGLGLATVFGIVKQNDGFINVYSEPGEGTTFKIYLPRYEGQVVETQVANEDEIPMGRGEMVLVVEDEASILKLADRVLSNLNYRVLTATSPTESLEMAKARAEEISLLITDVVMPEMNGRELADQIKAICPDIQCLFMSGYPANVIAQRGVLDRGLDFIQKPFSKMELATKVRRALDS